MSNLSVMDITAPYTPGVLRDGSHAHAFSPDGERVGFTYNDHVVHELDPAPDLRNVGVVAPFGPFNVQKQHPCGYSGSRWCVLVSKTMPTLQPGSDETNRAHEGGWIGNHALAFIGNTLSPKGEEVPELFIAELLQDEAGWRAVGDAPLGETEITLPTPPRGVVQRCSTFIRHRAHPGLVNAPRHWVRCNP